MSTIKAMEVKEAVTKAGGIEERKAKKQAEKQQKRMKEYANSMVTRGEVAKMMQEVSQAYEDRLRIMFIQIKTLTNLVVDRGLTTLEELDNMSKPIVDEIYGKKPESSVQPTPTAETEGMVEETHVEVATDKKEKEEGTETV